MPDIRNGAISLALVFSVTGMGMSGCSPSSNQATAARGHTDTGGLTDQDFAATDSSLTDNDFAAIDTGLTDSDFSGVKSPKTETRSVQIATADTANDLYASNTSKPSAGPRVILPKTAPVAVAVASNQQPDLQQKQPQLALNTNNSSSACAEGAKKGAGYAMLGTLAVTAVDVTFFGGTITSGTLLAGLFTAGAKGAAVGCVGGAITGNPNAGATAITPQSAAIAPDPNNF